MLPQISIKVHRQSWALLALPLSPEIMHVPYVPYCEVIPKFSSLLVTNLSGRQSSVVTDSLPQAVQDDPLVYALSYYDALILDKVPHVNPEFF